MLKLRPYKSIDSATIISWIQDKKEFYQWSAGIMGDYPFSVEAFQDYSKSIDWDPSRFQMVVTKDSDPVGYFTFRYMDEEYLVGRLGFVILSPKYRQKGYGKMMIKLALHYGFDFLQVKKITLGVFENNEKACQCYLHAGFSLKEQVVKYDICGESWNCLEMETLSATGEESKEGSYELEESVIDDIIKRNHLRYAFQPIVEANSGNIYGYEALMRNTHGKGISAEAIMKYAKKSNQLYEIEKLTFYNVLAQIEEQNTLPEGRKIFINSIPGYQLKASDYENCFLRYSSLLKQCVVEITEKTEFVDQELEVLTERAKHAGFELAVDDYGTGYSNTTNLLKLNPGYIKIDHLLISNIHEDFKKQHFVKSIIEFGHENGILVLAEGVENAAELRFVIQLGVDLIQGFYTAKPSYELIDEIEPQIRNEILHANVRGQTQLNRNVYVVTDEKELPLMRVALEQNTAILISQPEFTLVGNPNYTAAMSIKIKDGCECRLVLRDIMLESFLDFPCIELGRDVKLTIVLEGNNEITKVGICVPDSSSLNIEGTGNLNIHVLGIQSYAIGNLWDAGVGSMRFAGTGKLSILVESDDGIGIGGGIFHEGDGLEISSGMVRIESASGRTIGIGCVRGNMPINIHHCDLQFELRVDKGIAIGCLDDNQNITVLETSLGIEASGNNISGIGSIHRTGGNITVKGCDVSMSINGQNVEMIGAKGGAPEIYLKDSILEFHGEGSEIVALGTQEMDAGVHLRRTNCNITIRSGHGRLYGAQQNQIRLEGGHIRGRVNE